MKVSEVDAIYEICDSIEAKHHDVVRKLAERIAKDIFDEMERAGFPTRETLDGGKSYVDSHATLLVMDRVESIICGALGLWMRFSLPFPVPKKSKSTRKQEK